MVGTASIEVVETINFILGGKAEFTVKNLSNDKFFKYKVTESKKTKGLFFVYVWIDGSYKYGGYLVTEGSIKFVRGKRGCLDARSEPVRGLMFSLRAGNSPLRRPMVLYHHGRCACCGRPLDDENSIRRGFGPVCYDRIQSRREVKC